MGNLENSRLKFTSAKDIVEAELSLTIFCLAIYSSYFMIHFPLICNAGLALLSSVLITGSAFSLDSPYYHPLLSGYWLGGDTTQPLR